MTRASEDALIQHFLPRGCAGWILFCRREAAHVLQDLQGVGGGKAVKLQPFHPCDESSAMYSQLTAM